MPDLTDSLDQLQFHDPARSLPALRDGERRAIRDQILASRPLRPEARRSRRRRVQRRRRVVLAVGLAAVAIALAGVFGFHTAVNPQPALAAQMNKLAKVAAGQSWTGIPGPDQYLYTASLVCEQNDVLDRKIWIATDGSGALDETLDPRLTPPLCTATVGQNERTPAGQNDLIRARFSARGLTFPTQDWHRFSTDPSTLLTQLRHLDGGPRTAAEDFVHIGDFMRESDAPPAIRSALYRAAALIPGVKLMGQQTDPAKQMGLGVGFYSNGTVQAELIFDQQTGRLLGEESYGQSGSLSDWTAYLHQKIVGRDALPDLPLSPASTDTTSSVNGG